MTKNEKGARAFLNHCVASKQTEPFVCKQKITLTDKECSLIAKDYWFNHSQIRNIFLPPDKEKNTKTKEVIDDLHRKKIQLEEDIKNKVSEAIEEFKKETSLRPSRVSIGMMSLDEFGMTGRKYFISGCHVQVEI